MEIFDCRFLIVDFRSEAPPSESMWRSLRSSIHNQQSTINNSLTAASILFRAAGPSLPFCRPGDPDKWNIVQTGASSL